MEIGFLDLSIISNEIVAGLSIVLILTVVGIISGFFKRVINSISKGTAQEVSKELDKKRTY